MADRFSSCKYGNNSKQTKKRKKKSPQCSIFSIKNKWIPESDWMSVNTFNLWDFDKVEDDINSFIAILQRKQYKDCNNGILFSIFEKFLKKSTNDHHR
jgi:hypothetical protein